MILFIFDCLIVSAHSALLLTPRMWPTWWTDTTYNFTCTLTTPSSSIAADQLTSFHCTQAWHVFSRSHSFTCIPTRSSAIGMSQRAIYLPLPPFQLWLTLLYRPRRDRRLSRSWCKVAPAKIRTCNLPIANPALYYTATSAPSVPV